MTGVHKVKQGKISARTNRDLGKCSEQRKDGSTPTYPMTTPLITQKEVYMSKIEKELSYMKKTDNFRKINVTKKKYENITIF